MRDYPAGASPGTSLREPFLCTCFGWTPSALRQIALERGITEVDELSAITRAGTGCRTCVPDLEALLRNLWKDRQKPPKRQPLPATVVRDAIRPFAFRGPWELQLIDVEGPTVRIRAIPRGQVSPGSEETLRVFVEKRLKEVYRPDAAVILV